MPEPAGSEYRSFATSPRGVRNTAEETGTLSALLDQASGLTTLAAEAFGPCPPGHRATGLPASRPVRQGVPDAEWDGPPPGGSRRGAGGRGHRPGRGRLAARVDALSMLWSCVIEGPL
jgi:hypothetical protein